MSLFNSNPLHTKKILTRAERLAKQHQCGIFFEDDYDYLQHIAPGCDSVKPLHTSFNNIIESPKTDISDNFEDIQCQTIVETHSSDDLDMELLGQNEYHQEEDDIDFDSVFHEIGQFHNTLPYSITYKSDKIINKNFDTILASYDKLKNDHLDEQTVINPILKSENKKPLPPVDEQTKEAILNYVENIEEDDDCNDSSESSNDEFQPEVHRLQTNLTNLSTPVVVETRSNTTSARLTRSNSIVSFDISTNHNSYTSSISESGKRERKKIERRKMKTENKKAFNKEILRQKNMRALSLKMKQLNY